MKDKQEANPFHMLTVDVEDWPQSTFDHSLPISNRVVTNTHILLEILAKHGKQATFFILGKVAEVHPTLAREIAEAGHEIGTHGYSHHAIESLPRKIFQEELHRSVDILRQQIGKPILGHRAADFSISNHSLYLLEDMATEGLMYDSSIFPIRHPRYGVPEAWRKPHGIQCQSGKILLEFPVATFQLGNMRVPGAGGGYLRLFPYWWTKFTVRKLENEGYPATCYMHPYELDPREMQEIPYEIPFMLRLNQGLNRKSVKPKLEKLLSQYSFITMAEAAQRMQSKKITIGLDLRVSPLSYFPSESFDDALISISPDSQERVSKV